MSDVKTVIKDLVAANRILSHEGIVDGLGHISVRNPDNPKTYFLSRSRSPELVTEADILEFNLDNTPVKPTDLPIYIERPIHGAVLAGRSDVNSVIHNHCEELLPFGITKTGMRTAIHSARRIGVCVPVWDIRDNFGDTDLLVTTNAQGDDLCACMGANKGVLMRGHGATVTGKSIQDAVHAAIAMKKNAKAITTALHFGEITYLTEGEVNAASPGQANLKGHDRVWEYLCRRAGVE